MSLQLGHANIRRSVNVLAWKEVKDWARCRTTSAFILQRLCLMVSIQKWCNKQPRTNRATLWGLVEPHCTALQGAVRWSWQAVGRHLVFPLGLCSSPHTKNLVKNLGERRKVEVVGHLRSCNLHSCCGRVCLQTDTVVQPHSITTVTSATHVTLSAETNITLHCLDFINTFVTFHLSLFNPYIAQHDSICHTNISPPCEK